MKNAAQIAVLVGSTLVAGCSFENTTKLLSPTAPSADAGGTGAAPSSGSAPSPTSSGGGGNSGGSASPTSTTSQTVPGFNGTWASPAIAGLPIGNCSDLQWSISSQNANSISGTVSAICGGFATITANLTGQLKDNDTLDLTASGSAVALGATCNFNLSGVGTRLTNDSLRLDYQGTTCLGPVSGSETLRRRAAAPESEPEPESEPQAPDPPAPQPPDVLFGCGDLPAGKELVRCIHSHIKPTDEFGAFEVTKRVAWALRYRGGVGLLLKPTGDNIVRWRGYTFSASRIMYPNGQLYKVISDVGPGGANGAVWLDDGFVDRTRYLPALDPALP